MELEENSIFRNELRSHFVVKLGDGSLTNVWHDNWRDLSPLYALISKRDIYESGLNLRTTVVDVLINGVWMWPEGWRGKYPFLFAMPPPVLIKDKKRCDFVEE